jgi:DNA (cytosine-5)-methyltransferase 3A
LYWTNIPNVTQPKDKGLLLKDILQDEFDPKYILSDKIQNRLQITHEDIPTNSTIGTTAPSFRTIGQRDVVYGRNQKMGCLVATDYKQPKQVYSNGVLRKITPMEAERLQTIDENYTAIGRDENGMQYRVSDTQRYKMIGNGWTIKVIEHIFKNLK